MICCFEDFVNYLDNVDLSKVPKTVYCSSRSYRQDQTRPTSLLNCNSVQSKPLTLGVRKDERFWLAVAKTGRNWTSKNDKVCPKSLDRLSNVGSLSYHLAKEVWMKDNPWSSVLSLKLLQVEHAQFNLNLSLMECYKRLKSLAKLQRHSLTKMLLTPFSTYSAREYIIIDIGFNFDNPDEISALIIVMFCIPRVLMRIRAFVQNGRHQQNINTVQD